MRALYFLEFFLKLRVLSGRILLISNLYNQLLLTLTAMGAISSRFLIFFENEQRILQNMDCLADLSLKGEMLNSMKKWNFLFKSNIETYTGKKAILEVAKISNLFFTIIIF